MVIGGWSMVDGTNGSGDGHRDGEATEPSRPRRAGLVRAIAVGAMLGYIGLLLYGLVPPNRSFGWERLYCPALAGPSGTASPVQQLRFGSTACASGEGSRLAVLGGLVALAALAGVTSWVAEERVDGRSGRRVAHPAVLAVAVLAAVVPWSTFAVWHRHDDSVLGPETVSAIADGDGHLCIAFAGGTWSGTSSPDDRGFDGVVQGTLTTDGASGTFVEDGPDGARVPVAGHWSEDPRLAVACAIR